jgi:hypothetical protein
MNIPAVHTQLGDLLAAREQPFTRPADSQTVAHDTPANRAAAPTPPAPATLRATSSLPTQAPAGTDPALWSILTAEERTFFARYATSGPLTYLKVMMPDSASPGTAASRGRRIDVRA